ncbi:FAD-dependent oxidoreductase [Cetobacterium somerae]|uniref:FAD-dependent oxidoreductase n=1 Tax=Cetobacterium somerae TaxID=188913 RepID=UPI00216BB07E|nr:FAD-dependent oxidoreductase [Cetobacterium somerae]MCQ9626386.1 FAD-dependent oxidoreductase [Cetobacterium somerae]
MKFKAFLSQNKNEYITEIQIPIKTVIFNEETKMKNGKFIGIGKGYGGDISIEVEINDSSIKNIEILSHNETKIISDPAFIHIPRLVLESNSILVPNVSGCSMSSRGIREAIKNALIQGGESLDKLEIQMLEAENLVKIGDGASKKIIKPVENFDVVIVGAGGAGLLAAISAASKGAKVVLLEKMSSIGGNTLISMGGINIPGNDAQIEKDIQDSVELYKKDILLGGDNENSLELLDIFVNEALPTYRWLKDEIKVSFKNELIHFGGHTVPRAAVFSGKYAIELIAKLRAKALSLGVDIRTGVRSKELITDGDSRVIGVLATIEEKNVKFMSKKGIILTTGGFSGNIELRKKYNPSLDERYNDFVKNKKDLDFNRRGSLVSISEGPYYIQKVAPAVHHTMGGVRINKENQVLNKNGEVIEGLFAAGEIVGGLHGTNRLGGNAITEIIVFGKRAGENI